MKAILFLFFISFFSPIFSQDNTKVIYTVVEVYPEYPGGDEALYSFISKNVKYPPKAIKEDIQGIVYVQFVVNEDGSISNEKIVKSPAKILSDESLRVVRKMPKWKPGKQGGKAVPVYFELPINFQFTK